MQTAAGTHRIWRTFAHRAFPGRGSVSPARRYSITRKNSLMTPRVKLRRALEDPELLGAALVSPSWKTWRSLLLAAGRGINRRRSRDVQASAGAKHRLAAELMSYGCEHERAHSFRKQGHRVRHEMTCRDSLARFEPSHAASAFDRWTRPRQFAAWSAVLSPAGARTCRANVRHDYPGETGRVEA
jgi:hypothetical protein